CSGVCTDVSANTSHCGHCATICAGGQTCVHGECYSG
ncbi:MAG: hypothetical protein HQL15_10980, partial [Candidatus Omnitrophica bacterium]|nr:hypothetical protein [Candidatus Omnitrophota bacterium]